MPKYIAFLRAINVGGRNVKMDRLRGLFEEMGFTGVESFIASGNILFESGQGSRRELERKIEDSLQAALGYRVDTFVRTLAEVAGIAAYQPFDEADLETESSSLYIAFLDQEPDAAARANLMRHTSEVDAFHVHDRQVYWVCKIKMSESDFSNARLEKALGVPATMRNARTLQRLAGKYAG